jgi:hypothetical protein
VPNVAATNFIKHTLMGLKSQTDPNTVIVGGFSTPLLPIDRSSIQKNQQESSRIE